MGWISAIGSLAGTIASGVGSAIANKREKERIEEERGKMNHWYNQRIYEDPTKRADYAAMMSEMKRQLKKKDEIENNKSKILGGTDEAALAMQQQNANAIADVNEGQMAAQAKRVDALETAQRQEETAYDRQQAALRAKQAETWGSVAANAAGMFSGFEGKGDAAAGASGAAGAASGNVNQNQIKDGKQDLLDGLVNPENNYA